MSKLSNIVKSRFIKGEDLPEWYEQRLEKCSDCPLNSANVENKDTKTSAWELIAGAHCTHPTCKCTITQKAKIEEEQCPKNPPEWFAIKSDNPNLLVIEANSDNVDVSFNKNFGYFQSIIGDLGYNSKTKFSLIIKVDEELDNLAITPGCGCTAVNVEWTENGYVLDMEYHATARGKFDKPVKVTYRVEEPKNVFTQQVTMIRIIGESI